MLQDVDEVTGLVPWVQSLASRVQGYRCVVFNPLLPKHLTVRPPPPAGRGLDSSGYFCLLAHHVPFLPGLQGALFTVRGERGRGRTLRGQTQASSHHSATSCGRKTGSPLTLSASKTPKVPKDVPISLGLARGSHFSGGPLLSAAVTLVHLQGFCLPSTQSWGGLSGREAELFCQKQDTLTFFKHVFLEGEITSGGWEEKEGEDG